MKNILKSLISDQFAKSGCDYVINGHGKVDNNRVWRYKQNAEDSVAHLG